MTYSQAVADAIAAITDAVVEYENAALTADTLERLGVTDPKASAERIAVGRQFLDLRGEAGSASFRHDIIRAAEASEEVWKALTDELDDTKDGLASLIAWDFDYCPWFAKAFLLEDLRGEDLFNRMRDHIVAEKADLAQRMEARDVRVEAATKALAAARAAVTEAEAALRAAQSF